MRPSVILYNINENNYTRKKIIELKRFYFNRAMAGNKKPRNRIKTLNPAGSAVKQRTLFCK